MSPRRTLLLFLLALAVVLPAMAWLTLQTLDVDRAEAAARRQAELEERVSVALWRMDTQLAPLVALEAARPDFVYRHWYASPNSGKGPAVQNPSPLQAGAGEHVRVHFQYDAEGKLTSPQVPLATPSGVKSGGKVSVANEPAEPGLAQRQPASTVQDESPQDQSPSSQASTLQAATAQALMRPDEPAIEDYSGWLAALDGRFDREQLVSRLPAAEMPQTVEQLSEELNAEIEGRSQEESQLASARRLGPQQQLYLENAAAQQALEQFDEVDAQPQVQSRYSSSRAGKELEQRQRTYQNFAAQQAKQQRMNFYTAAEEPTAREGVSRPLWIDGELLLARRVQVNGRELVQGCWLDWPALKNSLLAEVGDLLPGADLQPVMASDALRPARMLAGLPAELVVPPLPPVGSVSSPLRRALLIAWAALALAAVAMAGLLWGVVALSERRAAFVSAVTHELRTPLTTFRMYSEMLADGMVPDADQRQKYLQTLRVEADRLSHLVENVLSYARLERGRSKVRHEPVRLGALLERAGDRLLQRATEAEMDLSIDEGDAADVTVRTDAAAVEQILFNLVDNACKYATGGDARRIDLRLTAGPREARIEVTDHGRGLPSDARRRLFRPFSKSSEEAAHSAPGVGLGLALSHRLARQLGGSLRCPQTSADGTTFVLTLPRSR